MKNQIALEKAGECLYRNTSSGTYYALLKIGRKQIKRSLRCAHLFEARRKLRDFRAEQCRIDPDAQIVTAGTLCDRFLGTMSEQAVKTLKRKIDIVRRIHRRWAHVPR